MFRRSFLLIALLAFAAPLRAATPATDEGTKDPTTGLTAIPGCTLKITDWSDGDSFPIVTPAGQEITIRLYGADCFEWHVTDESDARRLRSQRRYFGIQDIQSAKDLGEKGALFIRDLLEKPFTVHTAWADGRGSTRFKRYYSFVTTSTGDDLATLLVRNGLARAFGVGRQASTGISKVEYESRLDDLELTAARSGAGAWALTDWDRLPEERELERAEDAELALALGNRPLAPDERVDVNTASRDELMGLPGIGEAMAFRIIESRPYKTTEDLQRVSGIGPTTLAEVSPFVSTELR